MTVAQALGPPVAFPRQISRELDRKWITQDSNWRPYVMLASREEALRAILLTVGQWVLVSSPPAPAWPTGDSDSWNLRGGRDPGGHPDPSLPDAGTDTLKEQPFICRKLQRAGSWPCCKVWVYTAKACRTFWNRSHATVALGGGFYHLPSLRQPAELLRTCNPTQVPASGPGLRSPLPGHCQGSRTLLGG